MRTATLERLKLLRRDARTGDWALSTPAMLALSVAGACFTGLMAQLKVPIPGTPVLLTGQVFAVVLCGAFLGLRYGALSQALYVGGGLAGVPWFMGAGSGMGHLAGFTGGYLVGFVVAAGVLGMATRRFAWARGYAGMAALMTLAVGIIYLFGAAHLMLFLHLSVAKAYALGVEKFIAADLLKVLMAAGIVTALRWPSAN